jgi:deazaflavin-dependent oxidoreductase (nitroreductase family)
MQPYKPEYLYLTTIGRKTGNPHEIEIWYVAHEGRYYLVSEGRERSNWVQNIQNNPAIHFYVEGKPHEGTGRAVNAQAEPELAEAVRAKMKAKYNWSEGLIVELQPNL